MCNSNADQQKRRILLSPLNWGLGHATRLIPVIDALIKQGHYCLLAGESPSIDVLKEEFPQLPFAVLQGFNVQLSKGKRQWFKLLKQTLILFKAISREYIQTQDLIDEYNIDLIVSDNRYGVRSNKVASVIITHQTQPHLGKIFGFFRPLSNRIVRGMIKKFDACWIPDFDGSVNLSGDLSTPISTLPTHYTGLLSRLAINQSIGTQEKDADILVILSGPEPHRSQLEDMLLAKLINRNFSVTVLRAKPDSKAEQVSNVLLLPHCDTSSFKSLICNSKHIICRSGYSTLMDLFYCNKKALLIPTPGQYEQEYLADRMAARFGFETMSQQKLATTESSQLLKSVRPERKFNCNRSINLPVLPRK